MGGIYEGKGVNTQMFLNEFLEFKLGVVFQDKYNKLAVKEVLAHKENYSLIYDDIVSLVEYDDNDNITQITYESSYFDCNDDEFVAGFKETMELYKVFVSVFWNDIRNRKFTLSSILYGVDFLRLPSTETFLYPYLNYTGTCYIHVTPGETDFVKKVFVHQMIDDQSMGHQSVKTNSHLFYRDNRELLKKLKRRFVEISDISEVFDARFTDEELEKHRREVEPGLEGYSFDSYELTIGKNVIKFFATERGFDPLGGIFRLSILHALSEEDQTLEVVKMILY